MSDFEEFPKIPRLRRGVTITEKIDGTNGQIFIDEEGNIKAGSRSRWITPEDDNYGFARWVAEHADELRELGHGRHFGEWWGRASSATIPSLVSDSACSIQPVGARRAQPAAMSYRSFTKVISPLAVFLTRSLLCARTVHSPLQASCGRKGSSSGMMRLSTCSR